MNLLIVTGHFPPLRGGMADYSARLYYELNKRGHTVRLVTGKSATPEHYSSDDAVNLRKAWNFSSFRELRNIIIGYDPDLVLVLYTPSAFSRRGLGLPAALLLMAVRLTTRMPIFTYGHELYVPWSFSVSGLPLYLTQRLAIVILLWISNSFQVLTEARRERLARAFPWWRRKLGMIPCPPTLDNETTDLNWRKKNGISANTLLLSTMGLDHPEKGAHLLAQIADGLSQAGLQYRYITVGGITVTHRKVESWGYVSAHDAWNLIAASDLFIAPYSDGVSGRRSTTQNALASGTPVLTNFGENTDKALFLENALAIVSGKTSADFVDRAISLLNDPQELKSLGIRGQSLAKEVFSWNVHVDKWEKLAKDNVKKRALIK